MHGKYCKWRANQFDSKIEFHSNPKIRIPWVGSVVVEVVTVVGSLAHASEAVRSAGSSFSPLFHVQSVPMHVSVPRCASLEVADCKDGEVL